MWCLQSADQRVISDAKTMFVCQCLLNATATINVETELTRVNSAVTHSEFSMFILWSFMK